MIKLISFDDVKLFVVCSVWARFDEHVFSEIFVDDFDLEFGFRRGVA